MLLYLAGGINALSDADARDWRELVKSLLPAGISTLDPMRRDYRGREDESVAEIVEGDLADIDACDAILANCVRPSWGTAMELHHAATAGVPVYAVVPEGESVSPWLRYFSRQVFGTLEEAVASVSNLLLGHHG